MKKVNSILLVDDDEATNFINRLLIKRLNLAETLLVANNGREALHLLEEAHTKEDATPVPDLILLDINMPVLDGFGFLKAFQELDYAGKNKIRIAVLTTSLNPADKEKVKTAGVQMFLNKPLTQEALLQLVNR